MHDILTCTLFKACTKIHMSVWFPFMSLMPLSLIYSSNQTSLSLHLPLKIHNHLKNYKARTMRTSHGIIISSFLLLLLTIIFISISPTSGVHVNPTKMTTNHAFSLHGHHHRHFHCHRRSFSSPPSRNKLQPHYWCMQDPPSSPELDIDPRYGVEKRLVPSGPNPLHNWSLSFFNFLFFNFFSFLEEMICTRLSECKGLRMYHGCHFAACFTLNPCHYLLSFFGVMCSFSWGLFDWNQGKSMSLFIGLKKHWIYLNTYKYNAFLVGANAIIIFGWFSLPFFWCLLMAIDVMILVFSSS